MFAYGVRVSFCGKQVNIIILLLTLHSFYKTKKNKMRTEEASEAEIIKYVNLQIYYKGYVTTYSIAAWLYS